VKIQQAYEVLGDEQKRKEYDFSYSSNYKQKVNYDNEHPYQEYYQQQ
jgi:DnaJ-class molecular chaperone